MATASDVLRVARGELGATSGRKYWDWYFGGTWEYVDGATTPYCACGCSWTLDQAGAPCEGFPRAVAIDRRDGFARQVEPSDLKPGDVVGFDWDYDRKGDHVGIFVEWITPGETFRTIEFNCGSPCDYRIRYTYQVTIGVRPDYDGEPTPALEVDGIAGPATVSEWQRQLGMEYVDGIISDQLAHQQKYRRNVWAVEHGSGIYGSALVRAVQRRVGAQADGIWGEGTTLALQGWLKEMGYYSGGIDGDFGHHSVVALQRSLNDRRWTA